MKLVKGNFQFLALEGAKIAPKCTYPFKPAGSLDRCMCRGSVHSMWFHCVFVGYIFGSYLWRGSLSPFDLAIILLRKKEQIRFGVVLW